jgi:hypothetical protein
LLGLSDNQGLLHFRSTGKQSPSMPSKRTLRLLGFPFPCRMDQANIAMLNIARLKVNTQAAAHLKIEIENSPHERKNMAGCDNIENIGQQSTIELQ